MKINKTQIISDKTEKFPEFTTISSKGQIVIPISMRATLGLKEGDMLAANVISNDIIVLKKISASLTSEELNSLKKIQVAWSEIDSNKRMSKEAFLKELSKW